MSPRHTVEPMGFNGFPRVSGDEPCEGRKNQRGQWFSPRERG